jgi:ABC-type uncharacterized transport system permease subunit
MVPVRERLTVLVALRVLERDVEIEMVIDVVSGTLSVLVDVKVAVRVGAADTVFVMSYEDFKRYFCVIWFNHF